MEGLQPLSILYCWREWEGSVQNVRRLMHLICKRWYLFHKVCPKGYLGLEPSTEAHRPPPKYLLQILTHLAVHRSISLQYTVTFYSCLHPHTKDFCHTEQGMKINSFERDTGGNKNTFLKWGRFKTSVRIKDHHCEGDRSILYRVQGYAVSNIQSSGGSM